MKKILLSVVALGAVAVSLVGLSAFEAHVINVTARIENALSVPTEALNFGTVFPQEQLEKRLSVALSQSFLDEPRVDDVEYIIRQKPKCGVTAENGTVLVGPTWTGHVVVITLFENPEFPDLITGYTYSIDCDKDKPAGLQLGTGQTAGLLPSLCQYISKHPDNNPADPTGAGNDGSLNSFHQPFYIDQNTGQIVWNDTQGYLSQLAQDISDTWTIDLKVPCFGGFCAQDWATFVNDINPGTDASLYTQPIDNEHKVFGCNLWVEVTGVSEAQLQD